jgi:N utilization substance protein A
VNGVYLEDDVASGRTAVVIVPDDQLSLAIGREGQNARLAAKLTGWRIDIKSVTEAIQDALNKIASPPLSELSVKHSELLVEVYRIMEKKTANRTVMPEEYQTLGRFADIVERLLLAEREAEREARMAEINMVKSTLPQGAFELGVDALDLPEEVVEALQPLGNVGEIMWRFLIDENYLRQMLTNLPNDSFSRLQAALDKVVIPEVIAPPVIETPDEVAPVEAAPAVEASVEESEEAELVKDAFADEPVVGAAPKVKEPVPGRIAGDADEEDEDEEDIDALLTDEDGEKGESKKKKKDRQKRRHLIYDEDIGEVVSKRRRKGGRSRDDWDDYLD